MTTANATYQLPLTDLFNNPVATGAAKRHRTYKPRKPIRKQFEAPLFEIFDREALLGRPMPTFNTIKPAFRVPVWKRPKRAGRAMEKHIDFTHVVYDEQGKLLEDAGVIRFRGGRGLHVHRYYTLDAMGAPVVDRYSIMILAFDKHGGINRVPQAVWRAFVEEHGGNGIFSLDGTITPKGRLEFGRVSVPIPNHWRRYMRTQNLKHMSMRGIDWVVGYVQYDMKPFEDAVLPRSLNKNKQQIDNKKMYLPYNLKPKDRQKVLDKEWPVMIKPGRAFIPALM